MKVAIMQPYFFPYIGYFQLMNAADVFVVYDNIQYTKKGWISRNRVLVNGSDAYISLTIKKDSDYLNVVDRYLADTWTSDRIKMLNRIKESYRKAPHFDDVYDLLNECILFDEKNLFKFIYHSLIKIKEYLGIKTKILVSSSINIDHNLKSEQKVIALCKSQMATVYVNPIGGLELYDKVEFFKNGLDLKFIKSNPIQYKQFSSKFVPWLSIIDVLMFNTKEDIQDYLTEFHFN